MSKRTGDLLRELFDSHEKLRVLRENTRVAILEVEKAEINEHTKATLVLLAKSQTLEEHNVAYNEYMNCVKHRKAKQLDLKEAKAKESIGEVKWDRLREEIETRVPWSL